MNSQIKTLPLPKLTRFERATILKDNKNILEYLTKSKAIIESWPLEIVTKQKNNLTVLQVLIDHYKKQQGNPYAWS